MYQGNDCMSQISGLLDCYGQVQAATAFIKQVLASTPMPTKGVTDGSQAQPGQVGEWFALDTGFTVTGAAQTQIVTIGTMQPGDWDIWAWMGFDNTFSDAQMYLWPVPAGVQDNLQAGLYAGGHSNAVLVAPPTRASLTVPTLFSFSVLTNQIAAGTATSGIIEFRGRRMR